MCCIVLSGSLVLVKEYLISLYMDLRMLVVFFDMTKSSYIMSIISPDIWQQ